MLAEIARSEDDGGIGYCIAECILGCLASIMEYFNKVRFVVCSVCVCVCMSSVMSRRSSSSNNNHENEILFGLTRF